MKSAFIILNKICIERVGRKRIASFKGKLKNPETDLNPKVEFSITGDTLQDVIGKIEKQFGKELAPADYSYNYPLRKDEFIPIYKIKPSPKKEVCVVCGRKSVRKIGEKLYCQTHFNELVITDPIKRNGKKLLRNAPCPCNSEKKYKNCCGSKTHKPRHYFNSEYKRQEQPKKTA